MLLDVALTPAMLRHPEDTVCIMVDVLRASTSCATLLERGAARIVVAENIEAARILHEDSETEALLCGEVGGMPPEGFDYGNSPVEFNSLDLHGRSVILATSNGTRALHGLGVSRATFLGCLRNRAAVCRKALAVANAQGVGVTVLCAGDKYGEQFGLEDAFVAGAMIQAFEDSLRDGQPQANVQASDSARVARLIYEGYGRDSRAAFRAAAHGIDLEELGLGADLEFCGAIDVTDAVPELHEDELRHLFLQDARR